MDYAHTFIIEKNIKLRARSLRYPFDKMEAGDSFSVPTEILSKVRSAAYAYARNNNCKFAVRKEGSAARVWRVS